MGGGGGGGGGGVSNRGEDIYQLLLVPLKNIVPSRSYRWSKISAYAQLCVLKNESKNILLQFLSDHPETFRICLWNHFEETDRNFKIGL